MKISTNSIGNYKPLIVQNNNNISQVDIKARDESANITNEEKKFFTKLYPDEKEQISNYHFYNKDGAKNGVSLGSLFDRRG